MHNAAIAAMGLDWRYVACGVTPDRLGEAIAGARAMGWIGLNLTVPHKLLAIPLMDQLSPMAQAMGAVNTVVFESPDRSGEWRPVGQQEEVSGPVRAHGHNTDADALLRSLREDLEFKPEGSRVLILGTGGAGQTAALRLGAEKLSSLHLVNRTTDKAEQLARKLAERFPGLTVDVGYPDGPIDLVVQATSLGLRPDDPPSWNSDRLDWKRVKAVYDTIYRPAETPLLKAAREAGCRTANGLGMLLYQGSAALELWTGKPVPVDVMRDALNKDCHG